MVGLMIGAGVPEVILVERDVSEGCLGWATLLNAVFIPRIYKSVKSESNCDLLCQTERRRTHLI